MPDFWTWAGSTLIIGAALLVNPGGLVRRESWRVQLGVGVYDHDFAYLASEPDAAPVIVDRGAAALTPYLAVQGATDIGQGSNTVITQICADALGIEGIARDLAAKASEAGA